MAAGIIQNLNKDHRSWISMLESCQRDLKKLRSKVTSGNGSDQEELNAIDHHLRLAAKLRIAIQSHIDFVEEFRKEGMIGEEFMDLEGHERNHQHLLNLLDGVKKIRHHFLDQGSRNFAYAE